jgi:hypothetical protein
MASQLIGTATEITEIGNLKDILDNGIQAIVMFGTSEFFCLCKNDITSQYNCKFIPSDMAVSYPDYATFEANVFPMLTTFLL